MRLDEFKRNSTTLEVKFENDYAIWDRIGQFWNALKLLRPEIEPTNASPTTTTFSSGKDAEITVEVGRFNITWYNFERGFDERFARLVADVSNTSHQIFNLNAYTRVGYRTIYFKEADSIDDANEQFFDLGLVKVPEARSLNVNGKAAHPDYKMGFEDETHGYTLRIHPAKAEVNLTVPMNITSWIDVHSGKHTRHGLLLDIDYYTTVTVSHSQLNFSEWINNINRAVRRDIHLYLGA